MKTLLLLILPMLILSSCGDINNPVRNRTIPVTGCEKTSLCLDMAKWDISVTKTKFPKNMALVVNDTLLINECSPILIPSTVTRKPDVLLEIDSGAIPVEGKLKLKIVNLGRKCDKEKIYYSNSKQKYKIIKKDSRRFVKILIN
jgi:hypothetical protein